MISHNSDEVNPDPQLSSAHKVSQNSETVSKTALSLSPDLRKISSSGRSVPIKDGKEVSKEDPCEFCGRTQWCFRSADRNLLLCGRIDNTLSHNKTAMLDKGAEPRSEDVVTPEDEIKDPFVLEFLNLKDEYSENDLEEALIRHIESFLLELGGDFTFVGRQRRLRIGDQWFRVDLLFFHRRLRCLVLIELKLEDFSYADAGQM